MKLTALRLFSGLSLLVAIPLSAYANSNPVVSASEGFSLQSLFRGLLGMFFIMFVA
jgi:CNT family concentrative nucleoside transporter